MAAVDRRGRGRGQGEEGGGGLSYRELTNKITNDLQGMVVMKDIDCFVWVIWSTKV